MTVVLDPRCQYKDKRPDESAKRRGGENEMGDVVRMVE